MRELEVSTQRRAFILGAAAAVAAGAFPSIANAKGLGLGSLLGSATDNALDKLALPGAFYDDSDVRIGLPLLGGGGGAFSKVLSLGRKTRLLDGLVRKLNDAAGVAAGEAKPIFRNAIDELSFTDVPGIVSKDDGGTQYLKQSSSDELHDKLRPLIDSALGDHGAYEQLDSLSAKHSFLGLAGIDRDGLGKSVTNQGLNGIFKYIGSEEAKLRANPLGKAGGLLKGMKGVLGN